MTTAIEQHALNVQQAEMTRQVAMKRATTQAQARAIDIAYHQQRLLSALSLNISPSSSLMMLRPLGGLDGMGLPAPGSPLAVATGEASQQPEAPVAMAAAESIPYANEEAEDEEDDARAASHKAPGKRKR